MKSNSSPSESVESLRERQIKARDRQENSWSEESAENVVDATALDVLEDTVQEISAGLISKDGRGGAGGCSMPAMRGSRF